MLRCKRCAGPFLLQQDWAGSPPEWITVKSLFPSPERQLGAAVPEAIKEAYSEASRCFRVQAYTACAVMCRKSLEAICAELGANGSNLARRLDDLRANGTIDARLAEWATTLRITGNEAAHGLSVSFDRQDASDILDFTEALTEYLFTFQAKFAQFRERRGQVPAG